LSASAKTQAGVADLLPLDFEEVAGELDADEEDEDVALAAAPDDVELDDAEPDDVEPEESELEDVSDFVELEPSDEFEPARESVR
jgi:hypothetical protein